MSAMQRVSDIVSSKIGDTLTNINTWGGVMYNVLNNGLVGDGTTDDTAALQTLINTAIAAGRKGIFFPHTSTGGRYYVTALTNASQVIFFGDNASFVGGYTGTINQMGSASTSYYTDVKESGVKGDGVTNDQVALQAIITASAIGDTIYMPPGTYLLDRQSGLAVIQGFKNGQTLRGAGIDKTILQFHYRSAGTYGLFFSGLTGFELSDMTIQMIDTPTVDIDLAGAKFLTCSSVKMRRVKVKGAWHSHGLRLEACSDSDMIECIADSVVAPYATGSTRKALSVGSDASNNRSSRIRILNCAAKDCIGANIMNGIGVADSDDITIVGNVTKHNDYGINVQDCNDVICTNNEAIENTVIGIDMSNGCGRTIISQNVTKRNGNDGIRQWGNTTVAASTTIIEGNVCEDNGQTDAGSAGIRLDKQNSSFPAKNNVVQSNICFNTTGPTGTQEYGILEPSGNGFNIIKNNHCFDNKTANESIVSTNSYPYTEVGTTTFTPAAATAQSVSITFKTPFKSGSVPLVIASVSGTSSDAVQFVTVQPRGITNTGCSLAIGTTDAANLSTKFAGSGTLQWRVDGVM